MINLASVKQMYSDEPRIEKPKTERKVTQVSKKKINLAFSIISKYTSISRQSLLRESEIPKVSLGLAIVALLNLGAIRIKKKKIGRTTQNIISANKGYKHE